MEACERIFGLKNFSRHEMFLVISQYRKSLVMSTPKPDNFMGLFWTFVGVTVWPKCFFICDRSLDEYFTKFIPSILLNFFFVSFYIVLLAKSSKWRKHKILNNCHNCFFIFCSYENSCLWLVVTKINVNVFVNYCIPLSVDILFINVLGDLDCILTGLVFKAYWPFAKEKDLTYITWYPSNQIR